MFLWIRTPSPSLSQWEHLILPTYTTMKEFLQELKNINPFTIQILLQFLLNQSK